MKLLKGIWVKHIETIDNFIGMKSFSPKDLGAWFAPLIDSINEDGAVPYLLNTNERFRASPLSSTIIWLAQEQLIPVDVLEKMQTMLLKLRDSNIPGDSSRNTKKRAEDADGWSLGEGVSVWSTSLAIIALLDPFGNGCQKAKEFKQSVLWLAKQTGVGPTGWAYQLSKNCLPNPVMSALAIYALALAMTAPNRASFCFSADEERLLLTSLQDGYDYIVNNCKKMRKKAYWCFNDCPHCFATTWMLLALNQIGKMDETFSNDCKKFYENVREVALEFVVSQIPNKVQKWPDEQIVFEGGAKYGKQKNYFSYSATLLPLLFRLGLSPYHPKVLKQIRWLIESPEEWKIVNYDTESVCTFTYAMLLATLTSWAKRVGIEMNSRVLKPGGKLDKASVILFGFNWSQFEVVQLVRKRRLIVLLLAILLALVVCIFGNAINSQIKILSTAIVSLWVNSADDRHDILIGIVSTIIYAGMGSLALAGKGLVKKLGGQNQND